jgi:hypothetical protein
MRRRRGIVSVLAALPALAIVMAACSSGASTDRAQPTTVTTMPVVYTAEVVSETEVDPAWRQGVARTDGGWVFSFNDGLFVTDETFTKTSELMPAIPEEWKAKGFDHLGDIDVVDGVLYAPLEQPDYDQARQAMLLYDAATLTYQRGVDVVQHHNAWVSVDPDSGIAYSMDEFGDDAVLRYDTRDDWRVLDPLPMSTKVERVQGGDVHDGAVWLSTDDADNGVYRVDLATGEVQALGSIGRIDGEGEGIDATPLPAADLHVLGADPAVVPMRLVQLRVSSR